MNIIDELQVINAIALATSVNSPPVNISHQIIWAIQFVWDGNLTGTVSVEASNNAVNWSMVSGSNQATNGSPGSHLANNNVLAGYKYIRATFTYTSGSGNLNVWMQTKGG